jgi:hypothetical protein
MLSWLSSWRRLVSTTAVCFVLLLALLAYRVSANQDPALVAKAATAQVSSSSSSSSTDTDTDTDTATVPDDTATQTTPSTQAS